ncbi:MULTISPECIES: hypothetical protein [Bacillus]|jgi:hypothetical protein|nr:MULTISPECIES: hypothetical protein [Bacillus]MBM6846082.1 hypothetical protein [Bacillus licheniformis]MBS2763971.1 hypothetical protein [Bacillus licheniformis]MBU8788044.1 hypothetical protein [Bacillus glycinifermentans]MCM3754668.1 hypothetical protein [Bacillus licheniformis]MCU9958760.1 hypothetical protein [Bacillus licheniformis]
MEMKMVVKFVNYQEYSELLQKAMNQIEQLNKTLERIENFKPEVTVD